MRISIYFLDDVFSDPYAEQEPVDDQLLSEEQNPQKIVTLESAEQQVDEKQDYFGHNEASSNEVEVATNLENPNGHYFEPDTPGDQFRRSFLFPIFLTHFLIFRKF